MRSSVDLKYFLPFLEEGELVLTPGRRLSRNILRNWLEHHNDQRLSVLEMPRVVPVDQWLEELWSDLVETGELRNQRLLSPIQEISLWQHIIRKDSDKNRGFTLLHTNSLASMAKSARDKLLLNKSNEINLLKEFFAVDDDCEVFFRWNRAFETWLHNQSAVTRYDAYRQLIDISDLQRVTAGVFMFSDLSPLVREALDRTCLVKPINPMIYCAESRPVARSFVCKENELMAAALWAHQISQKSPTSHAAIVSLDLSHDRARLEYYLREQFGCLDENYNYLPVNFSTGIKLTKCPIFRDALLVLEWEIKPLSRADWLALLRSPFLGLACFESDSKVLQLIEMVFRSGAREIALHDVFDCVNTLMPDSDFRRTLQRLKSSGSIKGRKCPERWAQIISQRLSLWGWPMSRSLDSIEYQQLQQLESSLDELSELSIIFPKTSYEFSLAMWRSCLEQITFQPKTPKDNIQVLGPLEVLGGSYDFLWICSAQRGVLPRRKAIENFVPVSIQKRFDFPDMSQEVQNHRGRQLLNYCLSHSNDCVISFHQHDQGVPKQASPFVTAVTSGSSESSDSRFLRWAAANALEDMPKDFSIPTLETNFIGGSSIIRDQAACPFRAFIRHRLKINELENSQVGITAREKGIILHHALFQIWSELGSSYELLRTSKNDLEKIISEALKSAFDQSEKMSLRQGFSFRSSRSLLCQDLAGEDCQRKLKSWLEAERGRSQSFRVIQAEKDYVIQLGNLRVALRPDRIDQYCDGRRIVIDYKTGNCSRNSCMGDRPAEPQLPLYSLLDSDILGVTFASIQPKGSSFIYFGESLGLDQVSLNLEQQTRGAAKEWPGLIILWKNNLLKIANAFTNGEAGVDPTKEACRFCNFESVCRIKEIREN